MLVLVLKWPCSCYYVLLLLLYVLLVFRYVCAFSVKLCACSVPFQCTTISSASLYNLSSPDISFRSVSQIVARIFT